MTQFTVHPPKDLSATIHLPASKSISNRALIINALSGTNATLGNISDCDDTRVMLDALRHRPEEINILAAGTAMRFLTAFLSVGKQTHSLTGTERMRHRPIGVLVDALRNLGAEIAYEAAEGYPPLRITGRKLRGGTLELPGNVSSQYVSALLMIGPAMEQGLRLRLTGKIVSRPYIDMTLSIMRTYGAHAEWQGEDTLHVAPVPYTPVPYVIENDWSAASYWYQIVALSPAPQAGVLLPGLFQASTQGDAQVQEIFRSLGVETTFTPEGVRLSKRGEPTRHLELNLLRQPDLAQTVVATCLALGTTFHITGLQSLRIKETDRIAALKKEFAKLGFLLEDRNDNELLWNGERCHPTPDAALDTYEDHRMAMSLAPCALRLGALRINNPEVVSKSYPHFWQDLRQANFRIEG